MIPMVFGRVTAAQRTDTEWELQESLVGYVRDRDIRADAGLRTDFASVPRFFVWLLPRYGRWTKAAILHDLMWQQEVPSGRMTRREADRLFREFMRGMDVAFWRRWIMWAAVRLGALAHPDGRKGWWRDLPRIAGVAVVALPIVALPAVTIGASLLAFYVVERLTWLGGRIFGRTPNPPALMLRTDR